MKKLVEFLAKINYELNGELFSVDVFNYVKKIKNNASIITVKENQKIRAFIAYYCNNKELDLAFLTMLAIESDSRKSGLGKSLLEISIRDVTKRGFKRYGLEVRLNNKIAIELYENFGFVIIEQRNENYYYMEKKLIQ